MTTQLPKMEFRSDLHLLVDIDLSYPRDLSYISLICRAVLSGGAGRHVGMCVQAKVSLASASPAAI